MIAATPNTSSTAPETRLTQIRPPTVSRDRNAEVAAVRITHHKADPQKTPKVSSAASAPPPPTTPSPAKIAANEMIVIGFVIVSPKIDRKAPTRPGRSAAAATSFGRDVIVRQARYTRNAPPRIPSAAFAPTSTDVIAVSPNAAMPPYVASASATPIPDASP